MEYWWTATSIHSVPLLAVQGFLHILHYTTLPCMRGLSMGALIILQNILVTSSQQPLTQLNIQIWSPGATRQLPTALAPRPDFHLSDQEGKKTREPLGGIFQAGSGMFRIVSQPQHQTKYQPVSRYPSALSHYIHQKKLRNATFIVNTSTRAWECFHMPPVLTEKWL